MKKTHNHSQFWTLFAQMPGADKEQLIWEASNMFTTSLTDFWENRPSDYKCMISKMKNAVSTAKKPNENIKLYRSGVLTRLQKYGVDTTNWTKVNAFLKQPKIAGKVIYELSIDELKLLIPKLESMITKKKVKASEINRLQTQN